MGPRGPVPGGPVALSQGEGAITQGALSQEKGAMSQGGPVQGGQSYIIIHSFARDKTQILLKVVRVKCKHFFKQNALN